MFTFESSSALYCYRTMSLTWSDWFSRDSASTRFATHEALFEGLKKEDNAAILYAQIKVLPSVKKLTKDYGLPLEQVDDILNQSTLILLRKIGDGSYQFQNYAPTTYLIEIVRRVALMATRALKKTTKPLDNIPETSDPDFEALLRHSEAAETVNLLLGKMGDPCEQVIRLHHIDGLSDEEVVQQQLTKYLSPDSLKNKRSDCMKKLVLIAQQWKTSTNI